jgi:hypothetical protein
MKPKFELFIKAVSVVNELPNTWSEKDCLALLQQLEFEDVESISPEQLRDYTIMALQDLDEDQASNAVVDFVFGDSLATGKKQNVSEEMTEDRLWEEYPDLACHERIFNAQFMLNQAFPGTPQPEIHKIVVELSSLNPPADAYLQAHDPDKGSAIPETLLVRCLAAGLSERSILIRLFEDQIKGEAKFPEAEYILWHVYSKRLPAVAGKKERFELTLYCPTRWTGELEDGVVLDCEPFIRDLDG